MAMKKLLLVTVLAILSSVAWSGQAIYTPGTMATTGNSSIGLHLLSVTHNPAAGELVSKPGEHFRLGYLSSFGLSVEYGDVNNIETEINDLKDLLDESNITLDEADSTLQRFNAVIARLADSGYIKAAADLSVPGFPMVFRSDLLGGSISLELEGDGQLKTSVLTSASDICGDLLCLDLNSGSFDTKTSVYVKGVRALRLGVGYSRSLFAKDYGKLLAGTKLNILSMGLSKQVISLKSLDANQDVGDVVRDDYSNNQVSSSGLGLDIGFIWVAPRYQLGVTFANLNEPSFDYGAVGQNCASLTGASADNCFVANDFANNGIIDATETYTMGAVTTLDGAFAITPRWYVTGSYDVNEYNDPVGDKVQMASIATTWIPKSRWIPGLRLGYHSNLTGSQLSQASLGTTLFSVLNLDLSVGLDNTKIDDETYPRSLAINMGFEQRY